MKQRLLLALLLILLFSISSYKLSAQVNAQDSLALVDLYNSTNGSSWSWKWDLTKPVATWHGISISNNRVTYIYLESNLLTGTLPESLGKLNKLTGLDLLYNKLSGSIPSSLGNLSNLERLVLDENKLSGSIPISFSKLKKLHVLTIADNQLTGNISCLSKLDSIEYIDLPGNHLSGKIPVFNSPILGGLILNANQFTGSIPVFRKDTIRILYLNFSNNKLSGTINYKFDSLTNLNILILSSNQLTGQIPSGLNKLVNLNNIDISNNQLSGKIPSLNKLIYLQTLHIENNQLTFAGMENLIGLFPFAVYSPQALIQLHNNGNRLSVSVGGNISQNTYNWYKDATLIKTKVGDSSYSVTADGFYYVTVTNTSAPALTLHSDTISVQRTVSIDDSLALVDLYNKTIGTNWTNHSNWLSNEPIANWFGITVTTERVTSLELTLNNLTGQIPGSIKNLNHLVNLNLGQNNLNGSIPTTIGSLDSLNNIDLGFNQLTGHIPIELGNLKVLSAIELGSNQLTGAIPNQLGNLINLTVLDFTANKLTGSIPADLGNLTKLISLSLRANSLTGNIPPEFDKLVHLTYLGLSNNQLSGAIPSELKNLAALEILNLGNNQLSGTIPAGLDALTNLRSLSLGTNLLTGSIPTEFGALSQLAGLDLQYNQLTGGIPEKLFKIKTLTNISVNNNLLSIPTKISGYTYKLLIVYMQNNQFNFSELEQIAQRFSHTFYSPQANITLQKKNQILCAPAGGTLINNTYKWYKGGSLITTIVGDSTFQPTESGNYYVAVTNAVANRLTLYSDTVYYNSPSNVIASNLEHKATKLLVYPNPVTNYATLSFNTIGKYTVTLTDISGKVLQTNAGIGAKGSTIIQLDVSKYSSGIYLITIIDEKEKKQLIRLLKNKVL